MERKLMKPKGRLRWYLNLINADIDSLSDRDIFNLWVELRGMAYGTLGPYIVRDEHLIEWSERREEAKKIKEVLKQGLDRILSVSKEPKKHLIRAMDYEESEKLWEALGKEKWQWGIQNPKLIEDFIASDVQKKPMRDWVKPYLACTHTFELKVLADRENVMSFFSQPEDRLILDFYSTLGQFPLSSIQKCQREDCGAYFLRATKREKRYCSNRCAWVMASRERRKAQPEKEKEKKRKSYSNKKKRELGRNVRVGRKKG